MTHGRGASSWVHNALHTENSWVYSALYTGGRCEVKLYRGAEGTIKWKLATLWTLFCYLIGLKGNWMDTNISGWCKSNLLPSVNFKNSLTRLKDIFIDQNRNHYNEHIVANKK